MFEGIILNVAYWFVHADIIRFTDSEKNIHRWSQQWIQADVRIKELENLSQELNVLDNAR